MQYKKLLNTRFPSIIMKIKDLPDSSQPRKRFLKFGAEALSDAELFAILLRTGTPGENVMEMANKLISKFGLVNLFDCSLKELQEIKGIGQNKAMQILAISELGKRYDQEKNKVIKVTCAGDVFKYFKNKLKDKKQEHFYLILLDTKNNIIGEQFISKGLLDASIIDPREVFKPAIRNSASRVILIHNHPSGDSNPSSEDVKVTEKLIEAGNVLGIKVLDHVIIGDGSHWSWKEGKDQL